jgi:hypothetical protein
MELRALGYDVERRAVDNPEDGPELPSLIEVRQEVTRA